MIDNFRTWHASDMFCPKYNKSKYLAMATL